MQVHLCCQNDSFCRKDFEKMKKLFQVYKSFMIRPTVYKAFPRLIVGLLVAGLWNRYANTMQIHQMTQSIFYLIGFIFLAMAWFSYLSLDGMENPLTKLASVFTKADKKRTKTANHSKQMIDFVEEDPVEYEDLDRLEPVSYTHLDVYKRQVLVVRTGSLELLQENQRN